MSGGTNPYHVAIKSGNQEAFKIVFEMLYSQLLSYAYSFVKEEEAAEELVQEAFLSAWDKRLMLSEEFNLRAYLYKSIHNQALNYLRHIKVVNQHKHYYFQFYKDVSQKAIEPNPYLKKAIDEAIEQLPERARIIFQLSRIDGLRHREIADNLNISEKTVEVQVRKARLFLQKKLKRFYKEL
ncbi:MAG: RNA polymerase sigma-70 factor [Salinivirgaceae bacterium]|nr:RNA polymerase sigma-70 factor [Salinivirgaceae bacterium]